MGRVVVLGSLNVDLVTRVERHPRPGETLLADGLERLAGGKGANQAVAAAAAGAATVMVGAVGDDAGGAAYVERLRGLGVDVTGVAVRPGTPTGTALIAVDAAGENTILVVAGANATVTADGLDDLDLGPGDVLLLQLEVPLDTVTAAARLAAGRGARVVLNLAPYAAVPDDVVALADPVVVNQSEAELLAASGATPRSLLVTLGADGARWGDLAVEAVRAEEVVDTTGAGDAFCGALAGGLAAGDDDEAALRRALRAGTRAVAHAGAQPSPAL